MVVLAVMAWALVGHHPTSADPVPAPQVIAQFNDSLLGVMKSAKSLGYQGRAKALSAPVAISYDMAVMTTVILGPGGRSLPPEDQRRVTEAFTRFTIATYADQFDGYNGERFEVGDAKPSQRGLVIVPSKIIPTSGDPIELDYLMRANAAGEWRIVDVLLEGTISQVAVRRSELISLFRDKGVDGLIAALDAKTAELAAKGK